MKMKDESTERRVAETLSVADRMSEREPRDGFVDRTMAAWRMRSAARSAVMPRTRRAPARMAWGLPGVAVAVLSMLLVLNVLTLALHGGRAGRTRFADGHHAGAGSAGSIEDVAGAYELTLDDAMLLHHLPDEGENHR